MENKESNPGNQVNEAINPDGLSRREFLKMTGAVSGALLMSRTAEASAVIEKLLNESDEKNEHGPKISVEFFLSWHTTAQDKEALVEKMKNADVFSPEGFEWTEKTKKFFTDVSKGKITPIDAAKKFHLAGKSSLTGTINALYNSGAYIEFFDIKEGDPLAKEVDEAHSDLEVIDATKPFHQSVENYKEKIKKYAQAQLKREAHIISRIEDFSNKIKRGEIPQLEGKRNVRILLSYGVLHTGLRHDNKHGLNAKWSFGKLPIIFNPATEAMRRYMFGKEVSDELSAKAFMSALTYDHFLGLLPGFDSQKKSAFVRKIMDGLSLDKLSEMFEEIKKVDFEFYKTQGIVRKMLEKMGINLPITLDAFEKLSTNLR